MVSQHSVDESGRYAGGGTPEPLSKTVDWLVTALLLLWGAAFAVFGSLLYQMADLDRIAEMVADGTITSTELTDAELIDTTYALVRSGGIGLAVTGALLFVGGIAYAAYRARARRERLATDTPRIDTTTNAVVGGVVTIVTAFVPFSPVLGGVVAGYLQHDDHRAGTRVGGLSGLVASVPLVVLFAALVVGFGLTAAELGLGLLGLFVVAALLFAFGVSVLYMVALGALGGYLGVALSSDGATR